MLAVTDDDGESSLPTRTKRVANSSSSRYRLVVRDMSLRLIEVRYPGQVQESLVKRFEMGM